MVPFFLFTGAMHSYDAATGDQVQHSGIPGKYSFAPQSTDKAGYPGCFKKQPGIRMAPRFTKSNNPPLLKTPLPSNEYERNKPPGA